MKQIVTFSFFFTCISALENITCGCINYDQNSIRCYLPPTTCLTRYLGNGTYAQHILLADNILPKLFKNDFQLLSVTQDLQLRLNNSLNNFMNMKMSVDNLQNQNFKLKKQLTQILIKLNASKSWLQQYYQDLVSGILFVGIIGIIIWVICLQKKKIKQTCQLQKTSEHQIPHRKRRHRIHGQVQPIIAESIIIFEQEI